MSQLQQKLANYPDWDKDDQLKRNRLALDILEKRRQKRLQLTEAQEREKTEFFEEFKKLIDNYRPKGSKLYNQE